MIGNTRYANEKHQPLDQSTSCVNVVCSVLLLVSMFIGCEPSGPKLHPVKGVVHVAGKPAEHAIVFMHRKDRNALTDQIPYGTCVANGSFEIETPSVGKGAQEGEYLITVFWPDMSKPASGTGERPDSLNGAYEKVEKSTITATVKTGKNELPPLDLVPGPARARSIADPNSK